MHRRTPLLAVILAFLVVSVLPAQHSESNGPYKILKRANVGGEGNWDYIYADVAGRRLYIPRRAAAIPPGAEGPVSPIRTRLTIFNLDTLAPVGEIDGIGGNGAAVDPKSGHGFTSSKPVSMFDTKTMKLIKTIDVNAMFQPDGIYFDAFNERVYVFSHPTKDALVIDAKDGTALGTIDLGGVPEQGVSDGKGTLYVVMQDPQGGVAVVDVKTMKTTTHYPFGDKGGGCNGLALDVKNQVLFAACARSGAETTQAPPPGPPQPLHPQMVILSAKDGKILATLPLAGGSDGAAFNPQTMEAFSSHGNGTMTIVKETSATAFEVEQNLQTINFARTNAFDSKTGHLFVMAEERGPAPPTPPGGRAGRGASIPGTFTILEIGK
jgi:DNA-binding beta-propeller fold protein YncE